MFKIYYTVLPDDVHGQEFDDMMEAMHFAETMRKTGCRFVTMVSENPNQVGKMGVDSVEDGLLPDGSKYTWNKASRIGATRR